jgi:hypothetical protein
MDTALKLTVPCGPCASPAHLFGGQSSDPARRDGRRIVPPGQDRVGGGFVGAVLLM